MTKTITFRELWNNPQILLGKKNVHIIYKDNKSWCANPVTSVNLTEEHYPYKESGLVKMIWIGTRGFHVGMKQNQTVEYDAEDESDEP